MKHASATQDLGLLGVRLVAGGLLAGHGTQKLFGWFEGHGLHGTGGMMEKLGLTPGHRWAALAGAGEMGGGVLTALGLLSPAGPLAIFGPMMVASRTAHSGKPIWVTSGGAELPVLYMAVGAGLALTGPGRFSLDHAFRWRMHPALVALVAAVVAGSTMMTLSSRKEQPSVPTGPSAAENAESTATPASAGTTTSAS